MELIAWSIPLFSLAIAVEWAVARRRRRDIYRLAVAVGDIGCGVTEQLFDLVALAAVSGLYFAAYEWRWFELDGGAATTWLFGLVVVDLVYYWWHRASHEVNFLWASHAVHHHSEDLNLAVALRQPLLTDAQLTLFGLPLALLGLPPAVYFASRAINTLYQFWIHTELIGWLGPIEKVLNTPSSHRVHHGVNPAYLDKNYAGMSIVWDRLFGTYEREVEAPVYGTTKPLRSVNPLWANVEYFNEIAARIGESRRWRDKLWAIVAHPAWRPRGAAPAGEADLVARRRRFDVPVPRRIAGYMLGQMAVIVAATMGLMLFASRLGPATRALACVIVGAGVVTLGGIAERRRWAWPLELVRVAALAVLLALWLRGL